MPRLEGRVANVTHQGHLIEFLKLGRLVTFAQEKPFTRLAPSLQVRRIATVLNEAHDFIFGIEHVPANHRGRTLTVRTLD